MLTRISNITSYEHVAPNQFGGVACTSIVFHYRGEHYASRVFDHLTPADVEVEEERFLERRHRRTR